MRFAGFIGPTYQLDSVAAEFQRLVNWYPEAIETGTAKGKEIARFKTTPGKTNIIEVGNGPIRMLHVDPLGTKLVVSGNKLYKISFSGNSWSSSLLGSLTTSTGTVIADSNLSANGADAVTVLCDGDSDNYAYKNIGGVETFGTFTALGYSGVADATHVCLIDSFFLFNKPGTPLFYVSGWNTLNVAPLDIAAAEGKPDNVVALIEVNNQAYLFGQNSTEIFANVGNPDFPFERAAVLEKGCMAPYSVAKAEGVVFWLGRDKAGQGIIYMASGSSFQRISTHAIENAIQSYDIDSITTADAFTYADGGHIFYQLNFPDNSWVYDLTTKQWHERAYNNEGMLERDRASYHAFDPTLGIHLVGDYEDNRIYQYDNAVVMDDEASIRRIRSSPHIVDDSEGARLFYGHLKLDFEVGVGLSGGVQGEDPLVMMRYSDDGGKTWSNEITTSLGKIGEYKTEVKFNRLGSAYDRIFEISISDPVKANLMGAWLDYQVGAY